MFTIRFDEALKFASRLHCAQVRKGTEIPYISHQLAVTALVVEDGGSEDEVIAALLHDAVEDQAKNFPGGRAGLRHCIAAKFGRAVLDIVNACTDDDDVTPEAKKDPATWRARKQAYLDHIAQISPAARRV
ncbi:MAG: HD domain-containing protein, partial [Planctomycetaceae bacterium]